MIVKRSSEMGVYGLALAPFAAGIPFLASLALESVGPARATIRKPFAPILTAVA